MVRASFISFLTLLFFSFSVGFVFSHPGHDHSEPESASDSAEIFVQYELPYPGMLPDNPLYFLKTIRDRVVSFLITDPIKRAEFNLLTSDKRIYAAVLLVEKGKEELAVDTLSKSNNYFHEAILALDRAKEKGRDIHSMQGSLHTSVKKHQQVVSRQLVPHISESLENRVDLESERLEEFEKLVN